MNLGLSDVGFFNYQCTIFIHFIYVHYKSEFIGNIVKGVFLQWASLEIVSCTLDKTYIIPVFCFSE